MSRSLHCVRQEGRLASKVVEPDLLAKKAANANEQVLRPPAAEQVALAVAEASGNQPELPEGQIPVQQVVNASNDGGGPANGPALEVSCFISFRRVLSSLFWPGFIFSLGGDKIVVLCLRGGKLFVLFAPAWRPVCIFYACVVLNCEFYFRLWGDKFMPVWRQVCDFMPVWL